MPVPPQVARTTAAYLALADAEAPGLVAGLYLEGSVALDDYRPDASDIDFVAVTAEPPDPATLAALGRVHARLADQQTRPFFDGTYLTWNDLAAGPATATGRPVVLEGRFEPAGGDQSPVTWHTLAQSGVTLRGPDIAAIDVWTDAATLAAWQNTNLDDYWARGLTAATRLLSKNGLGLLTDYGTVWTVTGIARLHYSIITDEITSKDGAAVHAREHFPHRWHKLIDEALRLRRNSSQRSSYRTRFARRRDILEFGRTVIADAHAAYARRYSGG